MKALFSIGCGLLMLGLTSCGQSESTNSEQPDQPQEPKTIVLTQTGCQFLETEEKDLQFAPKSAKDCEDINSRTLAEREQKFKPLELSAGEYIFKVTNQNVPYELGFYLRGAGASSVTLPKVSGGGLTSGATKEYRVTLTPGQYLFSCPLNPTPDYPVIVN